MSGEGDEVMTRYGGINEETPEYVAPERTEGFPYILAIGLGCAVMGLFAAAAAVAVVLLVDATGWVSTVLMVAVTTVVAGIQGLAVASYGEKRIHQDG